MPKYNKISSGWCYRTRFTDSEGNKHQRYFSGFKTKKEAENHYIQKKLEYQQQPVKENLPSKEMHIFGDLLTKWFNTIYTSKIEETTANTRWYMVQKHILPYFASLTVNQITTLMIDEFYKTKSDEGLSSKTVKELHNLLNSIFSQAVKWSIINEEDNPVKKATRPKIIQREVNPWSKEEAVQFLKYIEGKDNEVFYIVAIFTGMRRGEILGLRWSDVDFERGKIHVRRSLARVKGKGLILKDVKTKRSIRQISISPYVVKRLQDHQESRIALKKLSAGLTEDNGMVFTSSSGNYKDPNNVLRQFNRYIKEAGVRKISIHDLRHYHATQLLIEGTNPKVVAERLGHFDVGFTLETYSHVNPDLQDNAALILERSLLT
ncbi:MAG: tyrosine-type recombinase/integrase [Bacillota bacterium]